MKLRRLLARREIIIRTRGWPRWRDPNNPYQGSMAAGWDAYHRGEKNPGHPWFTWGRGRLRAYCKGWHHARLAAQQGKRCL
jgi:hypothetical protein